jgi:hypothetical protein
VAAHARYGLRGKGSDVIESARNLDAGLSGVGRQLLGELRAQRGDCGSVRLPLGDQARHRAYLD